MDKIWKILKFKHTSKNCLGAECGITKNKPTLVGLVSCVYSEMSFQDTLFIEGSCAVRHWALKYFFLCLVLYNNDLILIKLHGFANESKAD